MSERPLTWQNNSPVARKWPWWIKGVVTLVYVVATLFGFGVVMAIIQGPPEPKTVVKTVTKTQTKVVTKEKVVKVPEIREVVKIRTVVKKEDPFKGWPKCELEDGSTQWVCVWDDGTGDRVLNVHYGEHFFPFPRG